jgi:hypothetical protein
MRATRGLSVLAGLAFCLLAAPDGRAQTFGLVSRMDVSVRSAGMGRGGNAVFWGGDPDYWGNPALLGYHRGVCYEWQRTKPLPDLSDDLVLRSDRVTLAWSGVGLSLSGRPVAAAGGVRLDYGEYQATSPTGEILGTIHAYEDVESFGVGVSVAQLADAVSRLGKARGLDVARYADVALGYTSKQVRVVLAPGAAGESSAKDRGILVRLTPYDAIDYGGRLPGLDAAVHMRLDLSYGGSSLNDDNPSSSPGAEPQDLDKLSRRGYALRVAADLPEAFKRHATAGGPRWALDFLRPMVSLARTWDDERFRRRHDTGSGFYYTDERADMSGWELTLLNVLTGRHGRYDSPSAAIHGSTWGFGVGVAYRDLAGLRFDWASVPGASLPASGYYLPNVHRMAVTVFADPVRIWRERRLSRGGARI